MKFLHTSDLHIGRVLNEFSLLEDQKHILKQIVGIAVLEEAEAVLIAGDVYDRALPSAQAVAVLDEFLTELANHKIKVFLISGNHDSPERVEYAGEILKEQGIYVRGVYKDKPEIITLEDAYGKINFVLLPFVKPAVTESANSQEAMIKRIQNSSLEGREDQRNIAITHFFVTNHKVMPELSDSEQIMYVGGIDNVDAEVFAGFDYVALGHLHKRQQIGEHPVYYSGTPLHYSFAELSSHKSITLVTMKEKGNITIKERELKPLHPLRKIEGPLEELLKDKVVDTIGTNDYLQVTLTNEEELIDPIGTLRSVYPNVMQLILAKNFVKDREENEQLLVQENKTTLELFCDFYKWIRGEDMDCKRQQMVEAVFREVEELQ